jgi:hypothetical protein
MAEIKQLPEEETTLIFIVGDALRFSLTILDPDPAWVDPDPLADPPNTPDMIPRDLTGWSVAAQIRKSRKKTDPIIASFAFNVLDATGEIAAYLSPAESTKLDGLTSGRWDFQLTDPAGDPQTLLYGPAKPSGQVTR